MNRAKCFQCGFVGWSDVEFCKRCGAPMTQQPDGTSYQPDQLAQNQYWAQQPSTNVKKGLAIFSLVLGILSFLTLGLLGIGAVLGIILALVAITRTSRKPTEFGGKGMAIAGLVLSITSLVLAVPMGIIMAIAIPNFVAARRMANEASCIQALKTIASAEFTYQSRHTTYGTLAELRADRLIEPGIGSGTRNGYRFTIDVVSRDSESGFNAIAVPIEYPNSGKRSFFVDEQGVIRAADNHGGEATGDDPPLSAYRDFPSEAEVR